MRILLTNDDGIDAPGIKALLRELSDDYEVAVAAPSDERSGAAMSLTIRKYVPVREVDLPGAAEAYSVEGTPVDCVKLATLEIMDARPDFVISGINPGSNIGINILYSGTVGVVMESVFQGLPAMAVSMPSTDGPGFEYTARTARYLMEKLFMGNPYGPFGLNVNMPLCPAGEIKGVRVTRQCSGGIVERYSVQDVPEGARGFILRGKVYCDGKSDLLDTSAVSSGWISLTPIRPNVTHGSIMPGLSAIDYSDLPGKE